MKTIIHGAGCCLIDYLYTSVDFLSPSFKKQESISDGDGGLSPGKLVFSEDLERFAGAPFQTILDDLVHGAEPDTVNLGGPAVVALLNTAQLLGTDFEVSFRGAAGNDETGKTVLRFLKNTPLRSDHFKTDTSGKPTASTVVLSDPSFNGGKGERTFINTIGAADSFTPEDITNDFFNSDLILFGGTALVPKLHDGLSTLLKKAKDRGVFTIVGTVYDFRNQKKAPEKPWPLGEENSYPYIDLLIADAEEAKRLSGVPGDSNTPGTAEAAADVFRKKGLKACIITQGSQSIYLYPDPQSPGMTLPVSAWVDEDLGAHPEKRGDTTGCGDNFAGGVIASLAEQCGEIKAGTRGNYDLREACVLGVASGGFALYHRGGAYFESRPGEKREKVMRIALEYEKQIGLAPGNRGQASNSGSAD